MFGVWVSKDAYLIANRSSVPVIRNLFPALLIHEVPGSRAGDCKEGLEDFLIKAALRALRRMIGEETDKLIGA